VWSSYARSMTCVLVLGMFATAKPASEFAPAAPPGGASRTAHRAIAIPEALEADGLIEAGSLDEMAAARDRFHGMMEEASRRLSADGPSDPEALPGAEERKWIEVMTNVAARTLRQEAVRLDRGGDPDVPFSALWNEMVDAHLRVMDRWPRLWRDNADVGGGVEGGGRGISGERGETRGTFLPAQLLLLCSPEAYEGESFSLPRECLFPRMATLPESLASCCIDPSMCVPVLGTPCPEQIVADIARLAELDALVGYRNGARYWMMPLAVSPRSRATDAAVARAQGRAVLEMIDACDACGPAGGIAGAVLSFPAALSCLRRQGSLWPIEGNPFTSVPGLRRPRRTATGRLICDVVLAPACLEAMPPTLVAQVQSRLAPDARIVLSGAGGSE
jgi:hypothetical protein